MINSKVKMFFATHGRILAGRDIYIPVSGDFALEQILTSAAPSARLYSNDVTLFSAALGHLLTNRPFRLSCINPQMLWLNDYLSRGPVEQVAGIKLASTLLPLLKGGSVYREKMLDHYQANFDTYFSDMCADIRSLAEKISIAGYTMKDISSCLPAPAGSVILLVTPQHYGDKKTIDQTFDWERPVHGKLSYSMEALTNTDYILYDPAKHDELPIVGVFPLGERKTCYIYSNLPLRATVVRKITTEKQQV